MDSAIFGKKFKELREARHTQTEIGDILGVGIKQIQRYEKGDLLPDHESVQKLCDVYNYDFVSLIYNVKRDIPTGSDFFKDELIKSLREQKDDLRNEVSYLKGQLRHLMVITEGKVATNQHALADLLVKQKIESAHTVEDRLSKENWQNYQKLKNELGIV